MEEEAPLPKKEIIKVDEATLKMRMDQDKDVQKLRKEKELIENKIRELSSKKVTEEELTEEALKLMQCDDPLKYRKKIKGFSAPFNMTEKDDRISKDDKALKYKFKSKEDKEAIKKKVNEIKKQRQHQRLTQEQEKDKMYKKHRYIMKNLHNRLLREKGADPMDGSKPAYVIHSDAQLYDVSQSQPAMKLSQPSQILYGNQQNKQGLAKIPAKLTLESLGQLKYEDIARGGSDDFNPADVLDENDSESEDEVLKRYRVDHPKVNDSVQSIPLSNQPENPYKGKQTTQRKNSVERISLERQNIQKPKGHRKGGINNSLAEIDKAGLSKNNSKKKLIADSRSKKDLLSNAKGKKIQHFRKGVTTDDEKLYKNKLYTERTRKANIPKGLHKTISKDRLNAYGDVSKPSKYQSHISKSVKKQPSNKLSQAVVDKSKP
jgi:hypothetical protein